MQEKLLLNQARNVDAGGSSTTIPINLFGEKDIIVDDKFNDVINEYNVYLDERENCTKVRLSADINLIASNIVFNSVTEIVKNEGSDKCRCLNYEPIKIDSTIGKSASTYMWGSKISDAIMDTQITWDGKDDKNYNYLCGIDIFDNHILRSKTKYTSYCLNKQKKYGERFNTIDEMLIDEFGDETGNDGLVKTLSYMVGDGQQYCKRYRKETIYSYLDSINVNLIEEDGWVGFLNKSQIPSTATDSIYYGTDRVLNNQPANKFIDMFPGRDRYSLLPHYNEHRNRYEKNWECCLTYPYSSTTEHVPFINPNLDTLKIAFIDETDVGDDGVAKCTVYTITKHGLNVDDTINIYRSTEDGSVSELVEGNVSVDSVIDDYVFTVATNDYICKNWVSVFDKAALEKYNTRHVGENEYRVEINTETQDGWYYDALADRWKSYPDGDVRFDTVFAINDYLNLDYETLSGNLRKKYFPYKRIADWFMYNLQGSGNQDVFKSLDKEEFAIYQTKDEDGNWELSGECLTHICEYINGLTLPLATIQTTGPLDNLVFNIEPRTYVGGDIGYGEYESFLTQMAFIYVYKYNGGAFNENSANTLFLNAITAYYYDDAYDAYEEFGDDNFRELVEHIKTWYDDKEEEDKLVIIQNVNNVEYENIEIDAKEALIKRITQYFNNETVIETYNLNSEYSPDGGHTILKDTIENGYVLVGDGELTNIGSKNLSFAKTVDNVQCKYYTRIFSRFPNFDFYNKEVSEENIYSSSTSGSPIEKYSSIEYEKQSIVSRIGFSKNVYGDDRCQIVFNDDIDLYAIRDNLGRPLTSLYLSFFKTNYGYKEWYGKRVVEGVEINPDYRSKNVEWSRCFGKLKCGFEYSPYIQLGYNPGLKGDNGFGNVHFMNDVDDNLFVRGLDEDWLGGGRSGYQEESEEYHRADFDEVDYRRQKYFYGDICCYSPSECLETSIQGCCNRFNTMQRELGGRRSGQYTKFNNAFSTVMCTSFNSNSASSLRPYDSEQTRHPEGMYYLQNYEIPIRTFSQKISEFVPDMIKIVGIQKQGETLIISASSETYYDMGAKPWLYDTVTGNHYKCDMVNVLDVNVLMVLPHGITPDEVIENGYNRYLLYSRPDGIPGYAEVIPKNSGILRWRELVQNGFEDYDGTIREYPFTNGCLYVDKNINIFLRRQDPFGVYGLSNRAIYYGVDVLMGEHSPIEDGNGDTDAFREQYIRC